ncbi:potassium channel family protein [Pontibacter arcticus]|uniref:Potassium channel protein n=1 Tax=Pontibacter arcticus TaxID=2080288 RepID=A0A364RBV5_9BACT|nr:potassium channel family protein [Pontibacter arcticus]RAU81759.1 potassium channel protein [Pontibacter arcticus]
MKQKDTEAAQPEKQLEQERYELLNRLQDALEIPMVVLGFIWLVLLVVELIKGLSPLLQLFSNIIWVLFIIDFLIKFILAPHKIKFLKKNILTTISLAVPALRLFRVARAFRLLATVRAARGLRLVKVVSSINRSMRSLGQTMKRRAFGYMLALTLIVILAGSAGIYAFENKHGLDSFGESVWWTVMLLTSIGSDYFPVTAEGRVLCLLLAMYGFAVFGYFTATLATFFIDTDANDKESAVAGAEQIRELQQELHQLRSELQLVLQHLQEKENDKPSPSPPQL